MMMMITTRKNRVVLLAVAAMFVAGCNSTGNVNKTAVGTVLGGALGGIAGNQIGGGTGKVVATIGGTLLGAFIGGSVGNSMDQVDQMKAMQALEVTQTGKTVQWSNPDNNTQYAMTPTSTVYTEGQPCREYTLNATVAGKKQQVYGTACRQADGNWKIVS
jgi:surface antigen